MKPNIKSKIRTEENSWRRVAAGLLLVAMLLANPFTGLGQGFYAVNIHDGVYLNSDFPFFTTATVAPGVTIDNANSGSTAIFGDTHAWTVINSAGAKVNGNSLGIELVAGGTVSNLVDGSIASGSSDAVHITGGAGVVDNQGTIAAGAPNGDDGVDLDAGGSVNNHTNATIFGNDDGISANGTVAVINDGTITGNNDDGVNLHNSGTLHNHGTIIAGDNGVEFDSGSGSVVNTGSITGHNNGVLISQGTVENQTNAVISGSTGVNISDTGSVFNAGHITGTNGDGIFIENDGRVNNAQTGTIVGSQNGIHINYPGWVTNAGSITGNGGAGVLVGDSIAGTVVNYTGAVIHGSTSGVIVEGNGTVVNDGSITGDSGNGVQASSGGNVNNQSNGHILGSADGVNISGGVGSVFNGGTITGTSLDGVRLTGAGSVENYASGTITGGTYGVEISGVNVNSSFVNNGNATVINDGSITGYGRSGVRMRNGGFVENGYDGGWEDSWATITGNHDGVHISGGYGYVNNYDYATITGQGDNGVQLDAGGTVNNYGTIQGAHTVMAEESPSTKIVLLGNGNGVSIEGDGTVNNYGGSISGGNNGILITGGTANVYNTGTVTGYGGLQTLGLSSGGYGTAIQFGDFNDTLTLGTGSHLNGDADAGGNSPILSQVGPLGVDALVLQGSGSEDNNFYNFETLTKTGGGIWTLGGDNTFANSVEVSDGMLRINGSLTTPLLTLSDEDGFGGVGGGGKIYAAVDLQGGFLAPGNSIGTLTIMGSLTNNGGDYFAEVDAAGNSDKALISDTATLHGGEVIAQITKRELYGPIQTYTILTATNGIIGAGYATNAPVETEFYPGLPLFLTGSVFQDSSNVFLTLKRSSFSGLAKTFNQKAVSKTLDALTDPAFAGTASGVSNLVNEFFWLPSTNSALAALDSLSGEIHGTVGMLEVLQQRLFNSAISRRMEGVRAGTEGNEYAENRKPALMASLGEMPVSDHDMDKPWGVWLRGFGTWGDLSSDGNAGGGNFTDSGMSGGLEYQLNRKVLIGFAGGYSSSDFSGDRWASGKADNIQFAGYGNYSSGNWYVDGVFSFGFLSTETQRHINVGSIQQKAKGNYDGMVFSMSAEGGYAFHLGKVVDLQPFVGLNYTSLSQDGFNETGAGGNGLKVSSVEMDSLQGSLGLRLVANIEFKNGMKLTPQLHAVFEHEFMDTGAEVTSSFIGGSPSQVTRGVQLGEETGVLGANINFAFCKAVSAFVGYDVRLNENLTSQNVSGGVTFSW